MTTWAILGLTLAIIAALFAAFQRGARAGAEQAGAAIAKGERDAATRVSEAVSEAPHDRAALADRLRKSRL